MYSIAFGFSLLLMVISLLNSSESKEPIAKTVYGVFAMACAICATVSIHLMVQ